MIITEDKTGSFGSFKLGFSRGLPSYMAPKLFTNKKTEEYLVTSLYAQFLIYNKIPVIGVEVCENDSDKGADTIIKIAHSKPKEIQITRFTLTEYLKRRDVAKKQVASLIKKILNVTKVEFAVNITVNMLRVGNIPLNNKKIQNSLVKEIVAAINANSTELVSSNKIINYTINDSELMSFTPFLSLQSIPKDFYSTFYGRDNIYIDLDFDNIKFSEKDVEDECLNIFNKKDGGKAKTLIIWADAFEILYDPKYIITKLKHHFQSTTFQEVFFFSFFNSLHLYLENQIQMEQIK